MILKLIFISIYAVIFAVLFIVIVIGTIRTIYSTLKKIKDIKAPTYKYGTHIYNPTSDFNNGLNSQIVIEKCDIPTNTSSFEEKIFRG